MSRADSAAVDGAVRSFAATMIGLAAHELNNRLAVMRETVGLLEDLARAGRASASGTARAHAALDEQVGRALNIVRTLSGLGTALGPAGGAFDVGAAVEHLVGLCERWAHQRSIRIGFERAGGLPRAQGDPALFLCLAHRLLAAAGESLAPGGSVLVRAAGAGTGIVVSLQRAGERAGLPETGETDHAINRELAQRLGGELLLGGGDTPTIMLAAFH